MADPYIRVRIQGRLGSSETWSVNPTFGGDFVAQVISQQALQDAADDIAALNAGKVLPDGLRALLTSEASVQSVRVEWYQSGERLTDVAESVLATQATGTGSANMPITTAVCASLLTARVGRRFRGRLFFPALSLALTFPSGRIQTTVAQYLAEQVAGWLPVVAAQLPDVFPWEPVVFSGTSGESTVITRVRVGDVPDNMRSRKDALAENYSTALVP